jgi:PAS domain S-box-containing protein
MKPSATSRPDPLLLLLFLIPVMGIIVAGSRSYIRERRAVETEAWHQLSVIADMKVGQLSALRTEWMRDAEMVVANSRLMPSLRETLAAPPGAEATGRVRRWMEAYLQQGYTHVALVDAQGQVRLGVGEDTARESRDRALALNALRAGQHVLVDFHRDDPPRDIHLALGVPLPAEGLGPPIGALVLKIEPAKSLYPLLQTWPTPSASGETLLVRREKDEIVYLTPLRHAQDAAMNLRRPVSQRALTAAQAVLGREGAVEGQDYRGVRVLAATRRVPDTPWYLIAKIDASEAYRPLHREMILLILIAGSLIVATGAGVALLWRHQRSRFYQQRYEAEIERRALMGHYDYLSRYANDIILLTDETGRIVEANDRATVTYGCAREELLQLNIRDLRDPATLADFDAQWRAIAESDGHVFETRHQRRDGTSVPVEVSVRAIDVDGVRFTQSIIRDITERKAMEESLRQAHQELAAIIETAPAGILVLDRDGKVRLWNKAAERMSGWTSEEVLGQPASDWKDLAATGPAISRRETTLRRKDGSAIEMIVTSAPLFDAD